MDRSKLIPAVALVVCAFALLFTSVRLSTVADDADSGFTTLPINKISPAPDWTLADARTGKSVNLHAQARQSPVVFSFWATFCGPCRQELPELERVYQRYKGRVAVYGVNSNDAPKAMTAFASQMGLSFPMLADARSQAMTRYGADAIPLLIVVDTRGKIRAVGSGYGPGENLETHLSHLLDTLLAEQQSASAS